MRRAFWALCTAWVAIIRSWMVSRTASAVATHQSRGVAEAGYRAKVETRCRWIRERKISVGLSPDACGLWIDGMDSAGGTGSAGEAATGFAVCALAETAEILVDGAFLEEGGMRKDGGLLPRIVAVASAG